MEFTIPMRAGRKLAIALELGKDGLKICLPSEDEATAQTEADPKKKKKKSPRPEDQTEDEQY